MSGNSPFSIPVNAPSKRVVNYSCPRFSSTCVVETLLPYPTVYNSSAGSTGSVSSVSTAGSTGSVSTSKSSGMSSTNNLLGLISPVGLTRPGDSINMAGANGPSGPI